MAKLEDRNSLILREGFAALNMWNVLMVQYKCIIEVDGRRCPWRPKMT